MHEEVVIAEAAFGSGQQYWADVLAGHQRMQTLRTGCMRARRPTFATNVYSTTCIFARQRAALMTSPYALSHPSRPLVERVPAVPIHTAGRTKGP
eukprot:37897-Chlamydomonas_euryale.AAC.16